MEQILTDLLSKEGIFAVLFVVLFVWVMRDSKQREERLMTFIEDISKQYEKLADAHERLTEDVKEIKDKLNK
jgi:hypothetical protein